MLALDALSTSVPGNVSIASFIMRKFTPNTTPKNAITMKRTLAPVNGFGETNALFTRSSSSTLRTNEIIGCRCSLTQPDIGYPEFHGDGFLGIVLGGCGYQKTEIGGLVPPQDDHWPVRRNRIDPDNMERRVVRAVDVDRHHAIEAALVQQANRIGFANRSIAEFHRDRIAVVQYVDVEQASRQQRIQHDRANAGDHGAVDDGARPDDTEDFRLAGLPAVNIDVVVVPDQAGFPADLLHDGIAGIDAQAALDAVELRAVTDIDPGRADGNALIAIDAVAGGFAGCPQLVRLLQRRALFAAVVFVGDVERPFVGERRLDARPRAHIDADLLAHEAGEHIGGRRQDRDPDIGQHRRLERHKLLHQRRRIVEIENPGAAGPPGDQQPDRMFQGNFRKTLQLQRATRGIFLHALAPVALDQTLDGVEQIRPHRLWAEISAPDTAAHRIH